MKRPMTTKEYFDKIEGILTEKGKMPDILDYGLGADDPVPMTTYEFDIKSNLDYGGSEGIYLDLWIERYVEGKRKSYEVGTYKTLRTDDEAMHIMAALLADFIIEEYRYVNANLDDFTWEGADVHACDEDGKRLAWGYCCSTLEQAEARKDEMLQKYPKVVIRNNQTRKEIIYEISENIPERALDYLG